MNANSKIYRQTLIAISLSASFGFAASSINAEQVAGYCGLIVCSDSNAAQLIKQSLGLGDAKLGWWDCRIQGKCQDLQKEIQKLKVEAKECSVEKWTKYKKDISELHANLEDLLSKFGPKVAQSLSTEMNEGLTGDLISHFKKCYDDGLFNPNPKTCITEHCSALLAEAEKLEVNAVDCDQKLNALYPHGFQSWPFGYEHDLIRSKLNAFKGQCIKANLIPTMEAYNLPIFKKDEALAKECLEMGKKLDTTVASFKIDKSDCTMDLYNNLNQEVKDYGSSLVKLESVSSEKNPRNNWIDIITEDLNRKVSQHFVKCEAKGLFPPDKTKCLSKECKEYEAQIKTYKIDKDDCKQKSEGLFIHTPYNYEKQLIKDELEAYKQKCTDSDVLPYKTIGMKWVGKKTYEAEYKKIADQIANMGKNGQKVWPDSKLQVIPYSELEARINKLEINKQQCNYQKSIQPMRSNISKYIWTWRNAGFEVPKDMDELQNKLNKFFNECSAKNLT